MTGHWREHSQPKPKPVVRPVMAAVNQFLSAPGVLKRVEEAKPHRLGITKEKYDKAIQMRRDGVKWKDVGKFLGLSGTKKCTVDSRTLSTVMFYCRRNGIDTTDLFDNTRKIWGDWKKRVEATLKELP